MKVWGRYNTSDTNVRQLCMEIPKNEIKSMGVPKLAVTSGISIHQNVCID